MIRRRTMVGMALLVLPLVCGIGGLSGDDVTKETVAWEAVGGITIDGDLSEWDLSSPIVLDEASQLVRGANFWDGPEGLSGTFYLMWDAENLYIGAVVLDDAPFMAREGFPPDQADAIGIFLSTSPQADPEREAYESTDFQVMFIVDGYSYNTGLYRDTVADPKGIETAGMYGYEQVFDGYEVATVETQDGLVYEAKFPLRNLANDQIPVLVPGAGLLIGFNVELVDIDMPCPGVACTVLAWTGTEKITSSPAEWGVVRFESRKEPCRCQGDGT
jgi:hypothetical protein